MTDSEIIKALEICVNGGKCKDCAINPHKGNYGYCTSLALKEALVLINRQKAEIEGLQKEVITLKEMFYNLQLEKSEAIKEFANKVYDKIFSYSSFVDYDSVIMLNRLYEMIDDLVKEMTEGKDND